MAAETNLEREFKFDIDPDFDPPDLRPVVEHTERLPEQHLTTTYVDTPDRRLWAQGITLRHRLQSEGGSPSSDAGKWTLKLPEPASADDDAGGTARLEHSWKGPLDAVPEEARAIVAGLVRRSTLEPVVILSTDRRRLLLHDGDGPWAEVDDDLATVTSGGREGLRFRQLELELLEADGEGGGSPPQLGAVLSELRRAGATPGGSSKLALAAGLEAPPAEGSGAKAAPDVRGFVASTLGTGLGWLLSADYRLRVPAGDGDRAGFDASTVRAAVAAVGRLRADVRVLGSVLDPVWAKHALTDLKWLASLLERLREEDVLVERVRSYAGGGAEGTLDPEAVEELVALLRSDRHLNATELNEALASDRYSEMVDRLQAAVREPPLFDSTAGITPAGSLEEVLRSMVTASWRVVRAEMEQLPPRPAEDSLEHLRILAGRLAHAAGLSQPYLGKKARKTASAARRLESVLAGLKRSDHAARSLAEIASHPAVTAPDAFLAGLVAGRVEGDTVRAWRDWHKPAKKLLKVADSAWET